jgi:hypothetical protein
MKCYGIKCTSRWHILIIRVGSRDRRNTCAKFSSWGLEADFVRGRQFKQIKSTV